MIIKHRLPNFNSPGELNTSLVFVTFRFPHADALLCLHCQDPFYQQCRSYIKVLTTTEI